MESISQVEKTLMELIELIKGRMGVLRIEHQSELADKSKVKRSVVNRLFKEHRNIKAHNLYKMLKFLDLLKFNGEINNKNENKQPLVSEKTTNTEQLDAYKETIASQKETIALLKAEISRLQKQIG